MGVGSAWGSREEMLHPRDSHGRFRSSWKMAEGVVDKIVAILDRFNPKTFQSQDQANLYVRNLATRNRQTYKPDIESFLRDYSRVNGDLRAGKPNKTVDEMRRIMQPLPDDVIVTRTGPPSIVGLDPASIGNAEELTGKLVRDKGFWAANIGGPLPHQDGNITFTMAVPAGTKALAPSTSKPNGELIFEPEQPFRITEVNPDGKGGFFVYAVATGESEGEAPVDIAKAVPEAGVPEAPAAAPQAPAAPGGAAPNTGDLGAPLSRKPGRPAGPPPAARNEGHVADNVGGGQAPEPPSAQATPEPAPSTPELPPAPEAGPDSRNTFREAFDKADLKVPTVGTRRKQFMDAYNGVASGKKTPQEAVNDLENAISANKKIIETDKADGTDSGPLPEDVKRLEALRDLIAEHFNFTGRKKFKESSGEAPSTPAKKAAPSPVAPKATAPEKEPEPERLIPGMAAGKTNAGRVKVGEKILVSKNQQGEWGPATKKTGATTITVTGKSAATGRGGRSRTVIRGTDENGNEISVRSAPSHQTFWVATEKKTPAKEAVPEAPKKSTAEADANIAKAERERKAQIRREMRAEREARGEAPAKKVAPAQAEPSATEKARTETIIKSLERASEPKKAVPAPQRPQIPAKDLSDKGLMQRFEAEIKRDNPDEARLKELGDELDRRDLETKNRVKGLSDADLEAKFQDEIRKDNPDPEEMQRLGDELDRRDAETAATQKKIDDLVAKGRDYRDAWAEVHGKDPKQLDLEERQNLLDQSRRAGESRETTLRRLYQEHVHRQYLEAEAVTRGHLLTPEGRSKGIDPKSLFQGSNVNANRYASDELKEYWQKNPRKTFLQYKADTLGREQDKEAAKKTEGIARNLELGERLTRKSPAKKALPAPPKEEKAPEAPEGPQLGVREKKALATGNNDNSVVASKDTLDKLEAKGLIEYRDTDSGRHAYLTESGRKAAGFPEKAATPKTGPKNIKEMLESPATSAETKKVIQQALADTEVPAGRPDIEKMTVPQLREEAKLRGKRIPSNVRRKADIVAFLKGEPTARDRQFKEDAEAIRGTPLKGTQELGSLDEARAGLNKVTIAKLREEADNRGIDIPKSARLKKDVIEAIIRGMAQQELDKRRGGAEVKAPETPKVPNVPEVKSIDAMTVPEMKAHAEANNLQVPRALRLKAEVRDWLKESLARKKEGIAPERVLGQRELKRKENAARDRLKEMRRQDRLTPEERAAEARGVNRGSAPTLYGEDLKKRFDAMTSSEQGDDLMVAMDPTRAELVDMAKSLNIAHKASANKQEIRDQILHWGLRRRLQSEAVSRPGPTGGSRVLKNAAERPGPKRSKKPELSNNWGVPGGEVNFHADGQIGMAISRLGANRDLEVNGDRLDNVLGKEATKLVRGDITLNDLIDKLRSIAVQLDGNGSPDVARSLLHTVSRLDSPRAAKPDLPDGLPAPLRDLMDKLLDSPLARSEGIGGRPNEVEALTSLIKAWKDEEISPVRLPQAVRDSVFNRRHESVEGKFEIDRAAQEAIKQIEDLRRTDMDKLRPPSQRKAFQEQPLPKRVPREALKSDLSDASMPELRAVAQSEGVQVPGSMRSKAEVAQYLDDVRSEKAKLSTMPELKGHAETLARMRTLRDAVKSEPDARIAPGWGGAPDEIIGDLVRSLDKGDQGVDNPFISRVLGDIQRFVPKDSPLQKVIQDARNDLDDIYINAQGGGGNIGPEKYHVGSTQGVEHLIRDVTPEALSDPRTKRDRISSGQVGANAKVTLPNGTPVFEKTSKRVGLRDGETSSDSEQLLSAMGAAVGAPTLPTMRMSPDTIYTDWVGDMKLGEEIIGDLSQTPVPANAELWDSIKDSREAKILGLLDLITFNGDRHPANWGVRDGKLVAIDNGMGWGFTDIGRLGGIDPNKVDLENSVFVNLRSRFMVEHMFKPYESKLKDNDFTLADIEKIRKRLEALRDQFRHLGREDWLNLSLKALDLVKPHAKGTRDLIA